MTVEEYKLQKSIIAEQKAALIDEEKRIEIQFIESNKIFDIGDKVKLTHKNGKIEIGFVSKLSVYFDRVRYDFVKEKKDGTMSQIKLYDWSDDKIEKI